VGSGVSVAGVKMGVMMIGSKAEQDAINNVIVRRAIARRGNLLLSWRLLTCTGVRRKCREEHPRNDIVTFL